MECKLEKATATYTANLNKLQEATTRKIHELTAYLQMEVSEERERWWMLVAVC